MAASYQGNSTIQLEASWTRHVYLSSSEKNRNYFCLTSPTDSKLNNMAEVAGNYKRWLIYIMLSLSIFINSMLVSGKLICDLIESTQLNTT